MKKLISGGVIGVIIALVGLLYSMNMLPVTAETMDDHIQDEQKRADAQDQKDAKQDLSLYYMMRGEKRRELASADLEDRPDIEEEMAQIQDDIDLALDKLKEKD